MNQKTLITLGVVALVAVGAALFIDRARTPRSDVAASSGTLVPDLREHVNEASKITFTLANSQPAVTLERDAKGWKVAQRAGYPADLGKLREYLLKLADASLVEQKTSNKDRYADLGVDDVSSPAAKGVLIEIDGIGKPTRFIVGTFNGQGGGTFVRRVDEAQSWLAKGTLTPDKSPADWLAKELANISADRVASVTLTRADGKNVRASKKSATDARFDVADVPKGRELDSEFVASGLGSVLADLRADDVAASSEVPAPAQAVKAHYVLFDGIVVDALAWKVGDKGYATFVAALDDAAADRQIAEQQSRDGAAHAAKVAAAAKPREAKPAPEAAGAAPAPAAESAPVAPLAVTDPAKDREQRKAALAAEVGKLNAAFAGWSFVLPAHKFANIDKSLDDLLKPLAAKPPKAPAKPAAK